MFGSKKQSADNTAVAERPVSPGGIQPEIVTEAEVDERVEFARLAGHRMLSREQIRADLQAQRDAEAVERFGRRPVMDAGVQAILNDRAQQEGEALEIPALRRQFSIIFDELETYLRTPQHLGSVNQLRAELDRVRTAALNACMAVGGIGLKQRTAQKVFSEFPIIAKSYS